MSLPKPAAKTLVATGPAWWRIGLLAPLLATLPLAAFAVALLLGLRSEQAADRRGDLQRAATAMAGAVEAEVSAALRVLGALAGAQSLIAGDVIGFRAEAQRVLARETGWYTIALEEPDREVMNLRQPAEAPPAALPDPTALSRVLQTGLPGVAGQRGESVALRVPVLRDGTMREALRAELPLASLAAVLDRAAVPQAWPARLVDAEGRLLAQRGDAAAVPPPPWPSHVQGLSGALLALAVPVGDTGWRLAVAAPDAGIGSAMLGWLLAAGALSAMLLGLGLAVRLSTRHRLAEEARSAIHAEQLARAAELERRRADLLATVSHELRTPLTGLLGYTDMLSRAELPPVPRSWVEQQRRAGEALLALVGDVLDFARLEEGAVALEDTDVDLFELLNDCAGLMRAVAQQKSLGLVLRIDPGLPRWARGDPLRLRQVVTNLLGNAIKYTKTGEVLLFARLVARPERLEIAVADTGIGIGQEELPRVFERFERGSDEAARGVGGSGLGLAISRRLVTAMGGAIAAESTPGVGSRFSFRIPYRPGAPPAPTLLVRQLRVLVAEDVPAARMLLTAVLERAGHAVTAAEDGARALAALHVAQFDLALVDLQMPGLDGFGVAAALRALPGDAARLPLIALTAETSEAVEAECRRAGFDAVMAKPFETRRLLRLVEALGRHAPGGGAPASLARDAAAAG